MKKRDRHEVGPRGGKIRRAADGKRQQLNVFLHDLLITRMDRERCHISRRAWLESVLCEHFGIETKEIV